MSLVDVLLARAFRHASPSEANQAIDEVREARGGSQRAVSYEVVLPEFGPDTWLTEKLLPKLVYFLDCRGAALDAESALFVSVFSAKGLAFLEVKDVVDTLAHARSLSLTELRKRYGESGTGDPLLLGGGT